MFYAVPIIYPISMVSSQNAIAARGLMLNPIAQGIQDMRYCLITHETITSWSLNSSNVLIAAIPIIIVFVVGVLAALFFKKRSRKFAEEV